MPAIAATSSSAPASPSVPAFLVDPSLRLLVFGGKGGVGKTTAASAAAISLALARPAQRVALVSTDPAHSVADALAADASLPPNLAVLEINAEREHAAFMAEHGATLKEIASRGTFLDTGDIDELTRLSLPGIDELMAFLKIALWVESAEHDLIVLDTAPTGHALRLLQMPDFLARWLDAMDALLAKHRYMASLFARRGPAPDDRCEDLLEHLTLLFDNVRALFTDPARCRFVPVMLAEELSAAETADLLKGLADLEIPVREVLVNRLIPPGDVSPALRALRAEQARIVSTIAPALAAAASSADLALWGLPLLEDEVRGAALLTRFYAPAVPQADLLAWAAEHRAPAVTAAGAPAVEGAAPLPDPRACRLLVVAGKGGVGKTTMAAAAALRLAAAAVPDARRILVVSTDPAHSLADCLALPLGPEPRSVAPGLWAMELDAAAEMETFREQYAGELESMLDSLLGGADMAFDRDVLERLLDLSPPGLDEVMALVRVVHHLDAAGEQAFDTIVLDTAPTGHTLRLLALPTLVQEWLAQIFKVLLKYRTVLKLPGVERRLVELSRGVKRLQAVLHDPASCGLLAVAIPTELALAETTDLLGACADQKLPVAAVVINLVTPAEPGASGLAAAVAKRESAVLARYQSLLGKTPSAVVHRCPAGGQPRGLDALRLVGDAVFTTGSASSFLGGLARLAGLGASRPSTQGSAQ